MSTHEMIGQQIRDSIAVKNAVLETLIPAIELTGNLLVQALKSGKKVLVCGNGGSAADAQHIAAELTGRFETERHPLPGIALSVDTSALTAIGNDYGFENVFERQVRALGNEGDVLIAISTSGNSPNCIKAIEAAHAKRMGIICLTGRDGGRMAKMAGVSAAIVPSATTSRIQESHLLIYHIWCKMIDEAYR